MTALHLILPGIPRTKKTHQRIVRFGRRKEFVKVLPSEAYMEWLAALLRYGPQMRAQAVHAAGVAFPIRGPVEINAQIYRDADRGDLCGFLQAIGDALQAPGETRQGLGIIQDDKQILSWDGSRLRVDNANPRIELDLLPLQAGMFDQQAPANARD